MDPRLDNHSQRRTKLTRTSATVAETAATEELPLREQAQLGARPPVVASAASAVAHQGHHHLPNRQLQPHPVHHLPTRAT